MASTTTHCFFHHNALTSSSAATRPQAAAKPAQLACRAHQKQQASVAQEDEGGHVSRRLALTVLFGAAAVASKVSPADAAYGEAGIIIIFIYVHVV